MGEIRKCEIPAPTDGVDRVIVERLDPEWVRAGYTGLLPEDEAGEIALADEEWAVLEAMASHVERRLEDAGWHVLVTDPWQAEQDRRITWPGVSSAEIVDSESLDWLSMWDEAWDATISEDRYPMVWRLCTSESEWESGTMASLPGWLP